jgi:hypothetical protein
LLFIAIGITAFGIPALFRIEDRKPESATEHPAA